MRSAQPPFEYLITSSEAALESFHLARLNQAANFRKELRQVMGEWIEAEAEARLARWILDGRRAESPDTSPDAPRSTEPALSGTLENEILPPPDALAFATHTSLLLHPPTGEATISQGSDARPAKKWKAATNAGAPQSDAAIAPLFPETVFEPLRSESGNRDCRAAAHTLGSVPDPSTLRRHSIILKKDGTSVGIAALHRALHIVGPIGAPLRQCSLYRRGRTSRR